MILADITHVDQTLMLWQVPWQGHFQMYITTTGTQELGTFWGNRYTFWLQEPASKFGSWVIDLPH